MFRALGLDEFFASIKCTSRIKYDLQGIVRLLVYGRLLEPASKLATMGQNDDYYLPLVKSTNQDNVYDALDVIYANQRQIGQRMNTCITRGVGRNTRMMFYDVTNFFFEIAQPDDDLLDDEGNVCEKGLRKMGVSKENRRQPIVQVGLTGAGRSTSARETRTSPSWSSCGGSRRIPEATASPRRKARACAGS